jgi:hypothetical protein
MAVPSDPTLTIIATKGLERGGQYNPSSAQITLAKEHFAQEVKADIMRVAPFNRLLQNTSLTITTRGKQAYSLPSDHNKTLSLVLLDGPDDWRGTAQGGSVSSIRLASSFSAHDDDVAGKMIITTGGTGSGQYRTITALNTTTKDVTPDTNFTTAPASGTTYLIVSVRRKLYPHNFDETYDHYANAPNVSIPRRASVFEQELYLYPPPDKSTYGLLHHYWVDLSSLDEDGALFIQLLKEWRSLWIQGIAAYTMQRYDDERFPAAWALYQGQLRALAADSPQYSQCEGSR